MTRRLAFWIVLAAVVALGLRAPQLDIKPLHTDEAVNAIIFDRQLWEGAGYTYDPKENHGPTLEYLTLWWNKLTFMQDFARMSEDRLRSLTVLFGLGLILLLPLVSDALGRRAVIAAAILTAVSPIMVYYSRDYIHETLFVFFTFLALAAGWKHSQTGQLKWILLAGAAIGLMQATKETFVFNVAAMGGALLVNEMIPSRANPAKAGKVFESTQLAWAGVAWVLVAGVFFSSFFHNPTGPLDAARTYLYWMHRAEGDSPHIHGPGFYWSRLLFYHKAGGPVWSEALIFALAMVGGWAAFAKRGLPEGNSGFVRFLLLYTAMLAGIYTLLPYKTPWCAMDFWHGMILLAGVGATALLAWLPGRPVRIAALVILSIGAAQLGFQAWQSSVVYPADPRNPWVYAQTSPDILNLVQDVSNVAQSTTNGNALRMDVFAPGNDYYPLPWYLRRFGDVGVGTEEEIPGYAKFVPGSVAEPQILLTELQKPTNAILNFLRDSGVASNINFDSPGSMEHQQLVLMTNLNRVITGPLIYNTNLFRGVALRPETSDLLRQNPNGKDLIRLNRRLLEDACTNEIGVNDISVEPYSPVTIVAKKIESELDETKVGEPVQMYELRPGVFMELYVKTNVWEHYLQTRGK